MNYEHITKRIFEAMHLKQIKHEGRRMAQVQHPDSVAEHSLVAAQIGYYLAVLEGVDPCQVVTTLVFHDLPETRLGDMHKIATEYLSGKKEAEKKIINDQMAQMPGEGQIEELFLAYEDKTTPVGIVAKDADYLEQAFQAKIYIEQGNTTAVERIKNVGKVLKTESAKKIWADLQTMHSTDRRTSFYEGY